MTKSIDKKDKAILYELDVNSRQPYTQIAKKVGLSRQAVEYRIRHLEKKGIIKGYYAVINLPNLGFLYARFFLKVNSKFLQKKEEFISFVKKKHEIGWFGDQEGYWDIVMVALVQNINELYSLFQEIISNFDDCFLDKEISIAAEVYHLKNRFIHQVNDSSYNVLKETKSVEIDDKDRIILEILSKNARAQVIDLASKAGISSKTVIERINSLQKSGIILEYRTFFDHKSIDYHHYHIFLTLNNNKNRQKLENYLIRLPDTIYMTKSIGRADLEFDVIVKNHNHLYRLMSQIRLRFPDIVVSYQTNLIFEVFNLHYFPKNYLKETMASP